MIPGRRQTLAWLAAGPLVLAGCDDFSQSTRRPLRIGMDLWAGYYPLLLARELGYLREAGLAVDVTIPENTDKMLADFAAQTYDGICVSIGDLITVTHSARDVRMILISDESAGGDVIFGHSALTSPEQLRGHTIATNLAGFGELFVQSLLDRYGVLRSEVRLVNVDASEVPNRLSNGLIQFGHTWEPYASMARERGFVSVYSSADTPGLVTDGLILHGAVLRERAEDLKALCRAWFRAADWWQSHPDEGDQRILASLPGKVDAALLKSGKQGIKLLTLADNKRRFQPAPHDDSLHYVAQRYIDHFVAKGMLSRRPTPAELLDAHFLP